MLFLLFEIGGEQYALPAEDVVEVLPLVELQPIRGAAAELAGVLRYRGAFVPVVDLSMIAVGRPAPALLGTRIVMVALGQDDQGRLVGLIAERATETFVAAPEAFAPFARSPRGLVQRLRLERLLPTISRERLFSEIARAA